MSEKPTTLKDFLKFMLLGVPILNGVIALFASAVIAFGIRFVATVVSDHATLAFLDVWWWTFWICFILFAGYAWLANYAETARPIRAIMRTHNLSFDEAAPHVGYKDEVIRFRLEKPENYQPWSVATYFDWRRDQGSPLSEREKAAMY